MVDLVRAYSKRSDLCEELATTLSDLDCALRTDRSIGPTSVSSTGRSLRNWRVSDRLTETDINTLDVDFRSGAPKRVLAERYKISESTVKRLLRQRRVRLL